jgi:periplasmic protein TonB
MTIRERSRFSSIGRLILAFGLVSAFVVVIYFMVSTMITKSAHAPRKAPTFTMVHVDNTPPPPPTPAPPPTEREQKMIEQSAITEADLQPDDPSPQTQSAPAIGTNVTGHGGPDAFGLGANKGGYIGSGGGEKQVRSPFGWYAAQVQGRIGTALQQNPATRNASFKIEVKIWANQIGRVTKATLASTTGDAHLDGILQNEILTGLQFEQPPPANMPMPIVLRISANRPAATFTSAN